MASDILDTVEIPEEKGIETHGIERVSPKTRTHVRILDNFTMWMSANTAISTIALGTLAVTVFQLGFWDSVLAIIIFNILGTLPVAFFSTMGPKLGLRQMTISRFSFGWIGAMIMALFNIAASIGWSVVNVIVGGQLIVALSGGAVPRWAAILIIAVLTTMVSIYGYRYVHRYERWAWIPIAAIFVIMLIVAGPKFSIAATPAFGLAEVAAFISFGGAVYGFATGWSSYAADYNVNQPEDTSASGIFWMTFLGVAIPCIILEIFGMALTIAYKGVGGGDLLSAVLQPLGAFGTFCLVLLALSIIANNIPNDYSLGLCVQVLDKGLQRVNRAVWTLMGAVLYVTIAVLAASNFNDTLTNFLLLVAYWLGPWAIILVVEHFVFRHGKYSEYNVEDWNRRSKLPVGWAAIIAMAFGLVAVYIGASQFLFTGPLAKALGGMDIGFELGVVVAGVVYFFLRRVELAQTGR